MKQVKILAAAMLAAGLIAVAAGGAFYFSGTAARRPEKSFADYMREADVYLDDNDYYKAIVSYENALTLENDNLEAMLGLADAYNRQAEYDKEVEIRTQIAENHPEELDNQISLIQALIHLKKYDEAKSRTEALIADNDSEELRFLYEQMNVQAPRFNLSSGSYDEYQLLELVQTTDAATGAGTDAIAGTETAANAAAGSETDAAAGSGTAANAAAGTGTAASDAAGSETDAAADNQTDSAAGSETDATAGSQTDATAENGTGTAAAANAAAGTATVYYTTDGKTPTAESEVFRDGIVISRPTTQVRAIAISALGFTSEETVLDFEITKEPELIVDPDNYTYSEESYQLRWNLQGLMQDISDSYSYDDPIYNYDAAQIRNVYLIGGYSANADEQAMTFYEDFFERYSSRDSDYGDGDISFLAYTPFVETLVVGYQHDLDLSHLENLHYLKNLSLVNNEITDISALEGLTSLEKLALGWNEVEDVTPLAGLTSLTSLGLWNNNIEDISSLGGLRNLEYFDISHNRVKNIDVMSGMPNLVVVWVNDNRIESLAPLDGCDRIGQIMTAGNPISDYGNLMDRVDKFYKTDLGQ